MDKKDYTIIGLIIIIIMGLTVFIGAYFSIEQDTNNVTINNNTTTNNNSNAYESIDKKESISTSSNHHYNMYSGYNMDYYHGKDCYRCSDPKGQQQDYDPAVYENIKAADEHYQVCDGNCGWETCPIYAGG